MENQNARTVVPTISPGWKHLYSAGFDKFLLRVESTGSGGQSPSVGSRDKAPEGIWGLNTSEAEAFQHVHRFGFNWQFQLYCWNECYMFYIIWCHRDTDYRDIAAKFNHCKASPMSLYDTKSSIFWIWWYLGRGVHMRPS